MNGKKEKKEIKENRVNLMKRVDPKKLKRVYFAVYPIIYEMYFYPSRKRIFKNLAIAKKRLTEMGV